MITRETKLAIVSLTITMATLATFVEIATAKRISKCSIERDLEMDACASKMGFLGDHSFRVPKNLTAAGAFCDQLKTSLACIQSYGRDCLNGFPKQVLNSLMKRGKEQYSSVCSDDRAKMNLMYKMACLADDKIELLHRCMDASVARFEYISTKVNLDNRLQGVCCSYQIFNRQLDSTLDGICAKTPSARKTGNTKEFIHKVVGGTAGEFFQLICDNHRSLEECRASKKTGDIMPQLEEVSSKAIEGKIRNKHKSLVPVLLNILDSSSQ